MISSRLSNVCNGDITKIENYDKATIDDKTWICHHRLETHFSDGTPRPVNARLSRKELITLDMYYNRPPEELIFMTLSEHTTLHNVGQKYYLGKHLTEARRKQISERMKGNKHKTGFKLSEETKRKISEAHKGRIVSEEAKRKMSIVHKGQIPWNKGRKFPGKHWKIINGKHVYY